MNFSIVRVVIHARYLIFAGLMGFWLFGQELMPFGSSIRKDFYFLFLWVLIDYSILVFLYEIRKTKKPGNIVLLFSILIFSLFETYNNYCCEGANQMYKHWLIASSVIFVTGILAYAFIIKQEIKRRVLKHEGIL